ncbi:MULTISPECIES: V-type ATP synthase subunit F [unclassified Streptomyces]|uniref:V-type ATP synthase subunit F n=1 Tax=unclassified Streptomyces TaxID=2593676 RepID=UPI002E2DFA3C|nr:V-type ATP synthase subunit F [Streptomyces sp. NBC_01439]
MGTVAAIGEQVKVAGLALAGVDVHPAERPEDIRRAWRELSGDVALVIVTPAAAAALGPGIDSTEPLVAVMPS